MTNAILFFLARAASTHARAVQLLSPDALSFSRTLVGAHVVRVPAVMSHGDGGPSQSEVPFGEADACHASATHEENDPRTRRMTTDTMDVSMTAMVVTDPANGNSRNTHK